MATAVRHQRFASVDLEYLAKNKNPDLRGSYKQWWLTVMDDGTFITQYGKITGSEPVGRSEKKFASVDAANAYADKKVREKMTPETDKKTGMVTKYTEVDVVDTNGLEGGTAAIPIGSKAELAKVAREQIGQGDPIVEELVARLAKENVHSILQATASAGMTYNDTTGLFSTPMGVITQGKINEARDLLATMVPYVQKQSFDAPQYVEAVHDYLRHVPSDFGHRRMEVANVFPDIPALTRQSDILESLEASLKLVSDRALAAATGDDTPVVVEPFRVFDVKMALVEAPKDIDKFRAMYRKTEKSEHHLQHLDIRRVFTIDIRTMRDAFEEKGRPLGGIKILWHGSSAANLISIMKSGLVIQPENCYSFSGRMWGTGLYFATNSSKSLQYSRGSGDLRYMFLADVAMGKAYIPKGGCKSVPAGHDSLWAKSGISGLYNDEIIIPHEYQCNLVYLLEFSRGGK